MNPHQNPKCEICHREFTCCPPQAPANPKAHGAKCRRANMALADAEVFIDPGGYGERFRAGWIAEDLRMAEERERRPKK